MLRRFVPPLGGFPYFPSLLLEVPPRMHKRWRPSSTSWIWSVHVEMLQPMGGVVKEDALNRPYARTTSFRTICKVLKIAGKLKRILSLWDFFSSILETRSHWRSSLMLWESSFWIKEKAPFCNTWRIITEQVLKTLVDNLVDHQAVSLSAYLVVSVLGITQTLIRAHQVKMMGGSKQLLIQCGNMCTFTCLHLNTYLHNSTYVHVYKCTYHILSSIIPSSNLLDMIGRLCSTSDLQPSKKPQVTAETCSKTARNN